MGNPKRIGLVMGDPSGIGPEVVLKAAASIGQGAEIVPVLIGSRKVFERDAQRFRLAVKLTESGGKHPGEAVEVIEAVPDCSGEFRYGEPSVDSGLAAYKSVVAAVELATAGELDAIVTGPISKLAFREAGIQFPGHTELLADLTRSPRFAMMLASGSLRVSLVTTHMALTEVAGHIASSAVYNVIELSSIFLKHYAHIKSPRIGVCALNPHGGEGGVFGSEEREIETAVRKAPAAGIRAEGPFPADSLFSRWQQYDCLIANYHDQGLIPMKMLAFQKSVNVTLGLPIIRTSPDHGAALDIAGEGKANPQSMMGAIRFAHEMSLAGRSEWR